LSGLDDLPLARASVRQEFLRRGRRWRDQLQEETERLRDSFQQAGDRFEERLEGWLEEEPERQAEPYEPAERWPEREGSEPRDAWDDWDAPAGEPLRSRRRQRSEVAEDDPWL
jgi:hypothetical protein